MIKRYIYKHRKFENVEIEFCPKLNVIFELLDYGKTILRVIMKKLFVRLNGKVD